MFEVIEALAIGFSLTLIFGVIFGFIAFMRYLNFKERIAFKEHGRSHEKEVSYE